MNTDRNTFEVHILLSHKKPHYARDQLCTMWLPHRNTIRDTDTYKVHIRNYNYFHIQIEIRIHKNKNMKNTNSDTNTWK